MNAVESLRRLKVGDVAVIVKVAAGGELGRHIRDMGLAPGVEVMVMGRAPLNDPVELKVKGYCLALRNNEADHIMVRLEGRP
ncbi:FeoA family protein [Desulfarculus baarsii DSM 2075]|uniref:FeoA family protein n=1 Tax=Desulfarculus baarsii (strain ATCC 33931 / DSM 2075 / LMG 7858 / VKM B-1802 / 2st14) TaxID=644282 RepID=E1QG22_DESB2|nr:FeoA family protein [Desulfarculus baarsii]ADK84632.1 FeoA family protein [Desulfarculus baarsii DSM 2075]